jgi:hypothetical protein
MVVLGPGGESGAASIWSVLCSELSIVISSFEATSNSAASTSTMSLVVIGGDEVSVDNEEDDEAMMGTPASRPPAKVMSRVNGESISAKARHCCRDVIKYGDVISMPASKIALNMAEIVAQVC